MYCLQAFFFFFTCSHSPFVRYRISTVRPLSQPEIFFSIKQQPPPPSRPGPSHYRGFTITFRHTILGRTPLDEWSARLRDPHLWTHTTYRHPWFLGDSNPRSQQASGRRPTRYTAWPLSSTFIYLWYDHILIIRLACGWWKYVANNNVINMLPIIMCYHRYHSTSSLLIGWCGRFVRTLSCVVTSVIVFLFISFFMCLLAFWCFICCYSASLHPVFTAVFKWFNEWTEMDCHFVRWQFFWIVNWCDMIYLLQLGFHLVAVVGRLVQK